MTPTIKNLPLKRPLAAAPPLGTPKPAPAPVRSSITFGKIAEGIGHRILLYGPGGIGKTTLSTYAPGPVGFFDVDESLPRLKNQLENPPHVIEAANWTDIRTALQSDGWSEIKTIVIDSVTKVEELCVAHTLNTVPHEKGHKVAKLEDYGYGKGYQFVFEVFQLLLGDIDRHCRAGRNVILLAHDCTTNVPNPSGEDWLRYEPRLQSPSSGKASIRLRTKEWADHCLFLGYDVAVDKDGKGKGVGTRTLWTTEYPHCMAKSRTTQETIAVDNLAEVWPQILK